ncbi:MAG: trypsin-like peptidase domain-containing protein [Bacilli bacterium]|nr:trypsin-like peptidase domain-containing protein [Bacilli bacterium]
MNTKKTILICFITFVITVTTSVVAVILYTKFYPIESKIITENINRTEVIESAISDSIEQVFDAVVTVKSYYNGKAIGTGSGFVYKTDDKFGYILTNNHVIEYANSVEILLQNGETVNANILGADSYSDLAVLSISKDKVLKVATLGDSDNIYLGETVFTVGSPMGEEYSGSITKGIISAKERTIETESVVTKVIQTDAAINPGNSGGPLVSLSGEVIGITSMKLADESIEGMGFAIPINEAKMYASYLEQNKEVSRPYLGVSLIDVNDTYKLYYYRLNVDQNLTYGTVIASLDKNSNTAKAGLEVGDVILKINNDKITSVSKLRYYLYQYNIGDEVEITYNRNGKEKTVKVVLEGK